MSGYDNYIPDWHMIPLDESPAKKTEFSELHMLILHYMKIRHQID